MIEPDQNETRWTRIPSEYLDPETLLVYLTQSLDDIWLLVQRLTSDHEVLRVQIDPDYLHTALELEHHKAQWVISDSRNLSTSRNFVWSRLQARGLWRLEIRRLS